MNDLNCANLWNCYHLSKMHFLDILILTLVCTLRSIFATSPRIDDWTNWCKSQFLAMLVAPSLQYKLLSHSLGRSYFWTSVASRLATLLAPTGALVVMMVYYIYPRPLFQIFTQSIHAIDVTRVTLGCLNSINATDVTRIIPFTLDCRMSNFRWQMLNVKCQMSKRMELQTWGG